MTTVNLSIVAKRILTRRQAAEHCGRSLKRFEVECPVAPIRFPNGDLLYDVIDLGKWLENLKNNSEDSEEIIKRLAGP